MYASLWIILFSLQCLSYCYENLSRKHLTKVSQSSTYYATRANDGITATTDAYCAHTTLNKSSAWFQVDLGQLYNIWNMKIYYRKEGDELSSWKQYRFRQFYLDVSNSSAMQTTTLQRTRCYTDNTTAPALPPNIIDIPCKHTARYVIVETAYDAPEDDKYGVHGAILEICEIEIYGCGTNCKENVCNGSAYCVSGCVDGYWGPACDSQCPANCEEPTCTRTMGYCVSCKSGYLGGACTLKCPMYCIEGVCDKSNGSCMKGCTTGQYGDTCNNTCSFGCVGETCDQHSRTCNAGCKQNWTGRLCDGCDSNHYGLSCSFICNSDCVNDTCNGTNGFCTLGCKTGFYGNKCDRQCTCCPSGCDRFTGRCNGDCQNVKQSQVPSTENSSSLYVVIAVLCISLVVNICTITWILRNNVFKRRNELQKNTKNKSNSDLFQPPGYMIQRWTMTNTRNWVNSVDLLTTISSKDRRLIDGHPNSNQNDTVTN